MGISNVWTDVTIEAGQSLSDGVQVGGATIIGLQIPTIDAAKLTFQASADGVTYQNVYTVAPAEYEFPSSTGGFFVKMLAAVGIIGANWLKIRSGTAAAPVVQTADRVFQIVIKD